MDSFISDSYDRAESSSDVLNLNASKSLEEKNPPENRHLEQSSVEEGNGNHSTDRPQMNSIIPLKIDASATKPEAEIKPKIISVKSAPTPSKVIKPRQVNEFEEANDEIAELLLTNRITIHESSKLQAILRENASLKDKITKLKTLLGRSAKASKETKAELDAHKRLLDVAKKEVERLNDRVEALASRPTHMDLLADFETNFDRALMNLHTDDVIPSIKQSVGQSTGDQDADGGDENVSAMLMNELSQSRARMEHLEGINASLMKRSAQLETQNSEILRERESVHLKTSNLQLELRMAKMETENASRSMREKAASLNEMQMEIDLVTKSAMDANARAAEGVEVAKSIKSDKAQVEELKAKVAALQEWACAAAEAKEAVKDENKILEQKLAEYEKENNTNQLKQTTSYEDRTGERHLWTKSSSLVIGAGTISRREIELGNNIAMDFETVILRWKFDITPNDQDIGFSILKGKVDDKNIKTADAVVRERVVLGGGGGEVQGAFAVQNACTLIWSNQQSWVRPRTVKYVVEALAMM
uniref:Uncharacterized protein n=1 Tax=Chaetoceros debilis TaxID=122233 RepID=A0A7S3V8X6_9STRA